MRLDRYVSKSLGISRKDAKRLVLSGRVRVGGRVVKDPGFPVENEEISVDGKILKKPSDRIYIALNKPPGFVTSTSDIEPTVLDLVDHPRCLELHPVGRLDKDARGLLLLTNDGMFTHRIISRKNRIEREYEVRVRGNVERAFDLLGGIELDGDIVRAVRIEISGTDTIGITVDEGRYHLVKRMLAGVGLEVLDLKRVRIGGLELKDLGLKEGEWKELSLEEVSRVFSGRRG